MPAPVLRVFLHNETNLEGQFSDKLLVVCAEQDIQQFFDDGWSVIRSSNDVEQIQSHNTNEDIVFVQALEDSRFVILYYL